jgi:hypothetical protein
MVMKIEVSNGEILDKCSILKIKLERIDDKSKLGNIQKEYDILSPIVWNIIGDSNELSNLWNLLCQINEKLWDIEDDIRDKEKNDTFDQEFIDLARYVYITNDERANIKKQINLLTNSDLVEEKSYKEY